MIIWSRAGILVPVIMVVFLALVSTSVDQAFHDPEYYKNHGWPKLAAFWLSAAPLWVLGRWLNRGGVVKELLDPQTGEKVFLQQGGGHSFFFIPVEFWAIISLVLGLILLFV